MHRSSIIGVVAAGILAGAMLAGVALAQEEKATGVAAVRQNAMDAFGGHAGAIQKILTEAPELIGLVPAHARAIAALAPTIPDMFPQGSTQPASRALPAIWENFDDFSAHADTLETLAGELATTAEAGDPRATLAAFTQMGRNGCGGCHNDYREKRD